MSVTMHASMPMPNAATAARNPALIFEHYSEQRPHSVLKYRLPREFKCKTIQQLNGEAVPRNTGGR